MSSKTIRQGSCFESSGAFFKVTGRDKKGLCRLIMLKPNGAYPAGKISSEDLASYQRVSAKDSRLKKIKRSLLRQHLIAVQF
jgi:hypothetical protein